jgi:hypothetical protein
MPSLSADEEARFWSKVDKRDPSGCWLWTACTTKTGYGAINIGGRICTSHRISWEITCGPIPRGMFVCHICDVRACVRPDHLFLGTHTDNMRDMVAKARHARAAPKGAGNGNHKLTDGRVRLILAAASHGVSGAELAKRLGVSQPVVSKIIRGDGWRHIPRFTAVS